jgi:four helix bundle protein
MWNEECGMWNENTSKIGIRTKMNDFFYKKLNAYIIAKEFTIYVYSLLKQYPSYEQYALCDQLRRASISVPSNIAEGMGRMAIKERIHFLEIAYASISEVLCQLDISVSLEYINEHQLLEAEEIAKRLTRVMSGLRKSLIDKTNQ